MLTLPTIPRLTPDDPQLSRLISAERVRMLFAPTVLMVWMSNVFAVAMALVVGPAVGWTRALTWAALCLLAGAVRLLHAGAYRRAQDRDDGRWLNSLVAASFLHGACWGLAGFWLMPVHDLVTTAVIVATLIGAGSICTFTLQAHSGPNLAMNLPLLLPAGLMLITRMDGYGWFGAAGTLSLSVLMLVESRRAERRITELLWLRFTTDRISQERAEALKLAQRHSAIKDQFLATMSHEMRTPLHGILGLAQLIHQRVPPRPGVLAEARQHAALIERSGEHLLSLINDVLDFSRIEAGKLHIDRVVFDLRHVLDEVLALSRVTASGKGLALREQIDLPRPCLVEGDPARVRQVLYNLLGNAVKFTDVGEVRLRAARRDCGEDHHVPDEADALHGTEGCARRISFHVEDTGAGIPPDQVDRIFEAFQQLDTTFGRRHQGTGLGLTISREIARAMGGDIVCSSAPGQGSVFALTLPLPAIDDDARAQASGTRMDARDEAPDTRPSVLDGRQSVPHAGTISLPPRRPLPFPAGGQEEDAGPPPGPAALAPGLVLLAEDNAVNALVAQAALMELGLTVTLVGDGQQALDLLTGGHEFDLVLMDCQMPVLDGVEATRRLRVHENETGSPNVPVIALTANAMPQDRQRCAAAGMDDHLAKPFRQEELRQVLLRHLTPRPAGLREAAALPSPASRETTA